jgi:YVTN family beta-propeller protein
VHPNVLIPRDRLIEELWGDAAPATISAVLRTYVSRLRRLLANGGSDQPLETQSAGYVLHVRPEQLDAHCFEALLEQGRRELMSESAEHAAATLRNALAFWRGPALADFAYERFAQREITRLEELRLSALEARIDADLALSRHDAIVAEVETLVSEHPYREQLRAQLMVALYRSGRQAAALEAYRVARRTLSGELGIEPGPRLQELERSILRQDASLGAPPPQAAPPLPEAIRGREARPMRWVVVTAAAIFLVIAAVVISASPSTSTRPVAPMKLVGDSVAVVDATSGVLADEIPVGGRPTGIAVGEESIWVANRDDDTLLRIDPRSREVVRTIGLGVRPTNVAVGARSVWILSNWALLRVDPDINDVVERIPLPRRDRLGLPWNHLEVGERAIWVCSCICGYIKGALAHIDPDTNSIVFMRELPVGVLEYGEGSVWALTGYELGTIEQIDPRTNALVRTIPRGRLGETATGPLGLAAGDGVVWSTSRETLWRLNPETGRFTGGVLLGHTPLSVSLGEGAIWVAANNGTLLRIDPTSQRVVNTTHLGVQPNENPDAVAVGEGAVWIAVTSRPPIEDVADDGGQRS